jgi:hypothetical protein
VVGQPISQASGWKTTRGSWKVKKGDGRQISAIRSDSSAADHPRYVGVKTTMEYHLRNGTKTDWVMVIHNMLTFKEQAAGFFIEVNPYITIVITLHLFFGALCVQTIFKGIIMILYMSLWFKGFSKKFRRILIYINNHLC